MNFKSALKDAFRMYRKNYGVLLTFTFAYIVIISLLCTIFSFNLSAAWVPDIFSFSWFLFIILAPISFSFIIASINLFKDKEIYPKDFYKGFKKIIVVWSLMVKTMLFPILMSILAYFACYFFGYSLYLYFGHGEMMKELAELIKAGSSEVYIDYLSNYLSLHVNEMAPYFTLITIISFVFAYLIYTILKSKKLLIVYLCLNSPININGAKRVNDRLLGTKQWQLILYNLIFGSWFLLASLIGVIFYLIFMNINYPAALCFACIIIIFIYSFIIPLKYMFYGAVYNSFYKKEVEELNQKYFKHIVNDEQQQ